MYKDASLPFPSSKAAFMKKRHVQETLRRLAGHLVVETDEQRRNVDLLYKALGEADVPGDERRAIQSDFSIGKADLFFDDTIPKRRLEELNAIARKIERREEEPRSLVFVREVPIRESLAARRRCRIGQLGLASINQ